MQCTEIEPLIFAYLDGELEDSDLLDFEHHVSDCSRCGERVQGDEAFHVGVRERLAAPPCPDLLRQRVIAAVGREQTAHARAIRRTRWAWALPGSATVAAAAALVLFVVSQHPPHPGGVPLAHEAASRSIRRASPLVVEGTRAEISQSLADYLQEPIDPPRFSRADMVLRGWRPSYLHGREAAELVYDLWSKTGRHRVSVHILDASHLDLTGKERRVVGGRVLWVDRPFGLSSVTYKDRSGIGYVFTSDLPEKELVKLVVQSDILYQVDERLREE